MRLYQFLSAILLLTGCQSKSVQKPIIYQGFTIDTTGNEDSLKTYIEIFADPNKLQVKPEIDSLRIFTGNNNKEFGCYLFDDTNKQVLYYALAKALKVKLEKNQEVDIADIKCHLIDAKFRKVFLPLRLTVSTTNLDGMKSVNIAPVFYPGKLIFKNLSFISENQTIEFMKQIQGLKIIDN